MESTSQYLNKYINIITEEIHLFLEKLLKQLYGIEFSFKSISMRNDLISFIEKKNLEENKILIKNLKEKETVDFRTTIYLFHVLYPLKKDKDSNIKIKFFENHISELMSLTVLINQYRIEKRNCDLFIERFLQNIYFVFKFIEKDFPFSFDKKKLFEMNKYMKILMLKNLSNYSVYHLHNDFQVLNTNFTGLSETRKDDLLQMICADIKGKEKEILSIEKSLLENSEYDDNIN